LARGHEIVMAGPGEETDKPLSAGGARGQRRAPAALYECAEYGYSFPAYFRLRRMAARHAPDILYERYNLFFHAGAWLARRRGLPFLLEVNAPLAEERAEHGDLFWKGFARMSECAVWRAADAVLPVSGVLAERLRAAGVEEDKITVIHNGVGEAFLAERKGGEMRARLGLKDKVVIGFAGFMRDWHGLERAVSFIANAQRDDLHLLLVGDGPARAGLEALARDCGVADRVTVAGVVQRDAAPDYVAAFDIALQPAATAYASPLKLFEYMALSKAILAPDQPNIREILAHGEDALLFAPAAPGAFDKALLALIADAALRERLGAGARKTLERRDLTWSGNARRIEAVAEPLLGKRMRASEPRP
jgi:glycosyltransferase involved in cell wall biosynthesis